MRKNKNRAVPPGGVPRQGVGPVLSACQAFRALLHSNTYKMDARVYARASGFWFYQAFFTVSTRAAKLPGSLIAISLSILRFSSMPDFFRPAMKVE